MKTCVYQASDSHGNVLYVGMSQHWPHRWAHHANKHAWWRMIAHLKVIWLRSRHEAQWLEAYLIRTHTPSHNRQIPRPLTAPDSLTTRCTDCQTAYWAGHRPPGTLCHDLSRRAWPLLATHWTETDLLASACQGLCQVPGERMIDAADNL